MTARQRFALVVLALTTTIGGTEGVSQSQPPTRGAAANGSPAWFLQGSYPDPGGRTLVEPGGRVTIPPRDTTPPAAGITALPATPACNRSPLCGSRFGPGRQSLQRVQWEQTLGYTFAYPYVLPPGFGGVPAVALDSKGNLWVFQRAPVGSPQLFKFDPTYKLLLRVGEDVIGYQDKAHGMAVDAEDNPWLASGQDGQFLKLDRTGKVIGAIGNGMGIGHGQFIEASYWAMDKDDNLYAGDTSVGRVTKMVAPKK